MVTGMMNDVTTWDAAYADLIEWVPDLMWPQSVWTYGQMRTDPQLRSVLQAYTLPITRAQWNVDPTGCRQEVAKAVADALGLTVLGQEDTVAQRGPVQWATTLRMALLSLTFGHMPFEKIWDLSDGRTAKLARLHERMPTSIYRIMLTDDDDLQAIQQWRRNASHDAATPTILRKDLVWFSHEREGGAWQGRSLLRTAYGAWLMKREMWRVNATSMRRNAMGMVSVTAPMGATPQQITEAQRLAAAHRAGDQAGVGLPAGFIAELKGIQGSVPDPLPFIQYLDQQMTRSALAGVVDLGASATGSRALGESFLDLLMMALQAIAEEVAETFTQDVATDVVRHNFGDSEPVPNIVVSGVGETHEVNATTLDLLFKSGALSPDGDLEAYVRDVWHLPPKKPGAPDVGPKPPTEVIETGAPPAKDPTMASAASKAWPFSRPPTAVEAASRADFVKIAKETQSYADQAVAAWNATGQPALLDAIKAAVKKAYAAGDHNALATLDVSADPKVLKAITGIALKAVKAGQADQLSEAAAQGVKPTTKAAIGPVKVPKGTDAAKVETFLQTMVSLMIRTYATSAGRSGALAWTATADEDTVAAAVYDSVQGMSSSVVEYTMGAVMDYANQEGRFDALDTLPPATYVASEIMDGNTCDPCDAEDGTEFDTLDDAESVYGTGGFTDCDGGLRCRGIIVTVWDDSASSDSTDTGMTDGGDG